MPFTLRLKITRIDEIWWMTGFGRPSPIFGTDHELMLVFVNTSNHRLLDFDGEKVAFRYKDYFRGIFRVRPAGS